MIRLDSQTAPRLSVACRCSMLSCVSPLESRRREWTTQRSAAAQCQHSSTPSAHTEHHATRTQGRNKLAFSANRQLKQNPETMGCRDIPVARMHAAVAGGGQRLTFFTFSRDSGLISKCNGSGSVRPRLCTQQTNQVKAATQQSSSHKSTGDRGWGLYATGRGTWPGHPCSSRG